MECVVFPKFFQTLTSSELGQTLRSIGFDGVDVMVRDGYWVTADTLAESLPEFVRTMHDFGLSTDNATTDYVDITDPDLEHAVATMAENGIQQFRLKGFPYEGFGTFASSFDSARRTLAHFEKLGAKHGIRVFFQTHGGTLHATATASLFLVQGFDPRYIGVHHDPANMICQEGYESWDKGFDALGDYLCMVGVKNAAAFLAPTGPDYRLRWRREWTTLSEGQVDWREVFAALARTGFRGPLCMHNFYERGIAGLTEQTRRDLEYLRTLLAEAGLD
ncbi:sugar phosphate isomerase/epimerase [Candidatus Poribacteria bacterium]|nr:sugar phosphate isomerase/epimerase [Candidatus Poribacteria bacterium]